MSHDVISKEKYDLNNHIRLIIGVAIKVHSALGVGVKDEVYTNCFIHELEKGGFTVQTNVLIALKYQELFIENGIILQILIDNSIVVEIRYTDEISELDTLSMINQLNYAGLKIGLIFNFKTKFMRGNAIRRVVVG